MNEEPETTPTFVAIISLSLPGLGEQFSANVTLLPQDMIQADGRYKALQDCTLADLEAYAETLEEDVWETYQNIKLAELAQDDVLNLELTFQEADGSPVEPVDALLKSLVVAIAVEPEPTAAETTAVETTSTETAVTLLDEPPATPTPEQKTVDENAVPDIVVAKTELVHEETEPLKGTAVTETPDIAPSRARVRIAGKRRPIGDPTWTAVDIFLEEPALRAAQAHALSSMNREVAGVLIGPRPEKQPDGRYIVHIHDTIIAKHTVMHGASVTYTPESWRYMNDVLRERYPDDTAVMVGWYHTHPGFGIFLSGMDLFIHQNFFTQIWHVAYVLDPRATTSGFFCWNRAKTEVKPVDYAWPTWAPGSW
jgi:proteasome lid subunit RPN8/RPN11